MKFCADRAVLAQFVGTFVRDRHSNLNQVREFRMREPVKVEITTTGLAAYRSSTSKKPG
jgi:hypothetical protein